MSEIKYTSDGRKVIVVGKLNAQETIVQEIFVGGDFEVPSGENFVVKSLHDAPMKSWKEKTLEDLEKRFDSEREDWNRKIRKQEKELEENYRKLLKLNKYLELVDKNVSADSFERLVAWLQGKIKWVVVDSYRPELYPIEKFDMHSRDGWNGSIDNIRLISLFGRDDGTLTFRINDWSDGSGHGNRTIYPFETKEEALNKLEELFRDESISESVIEGAEKYGIEQKQKEIERLEVSKENYEKQIEELKLKMND